MTENEIVTVVVESAIEVHRTLGGPGLLEAVHEEALAFELESRGLTVQRQKAVPLVCKGRRLAPMLRPLPARLRHRGLRRTRVRCDGIPSVTRGRVRMSPWMVVRKGHGGTGELGGWACQVLDRDGALPRTRLAGLWCG